MNYNIILGWEHPARVPVVENYVSRDRALKAYAYGKGVYIGYKGFYKIVTGSVEKTEQWMAKEYG